MGGWLQGSSCPLGSRNQSSHSWLVVECPESMCPEGWSRAKASPQKPGRDKDLQGASLGHPLALPSSPWRVP